MLACLSLLTASAAASGSSLPQQRILIVNSEGGVFQPLVTQMNQTALEALKQRFGTNTEIAVESLDLDRFGWAGHAERMATALEQKYASRRPEGVIAVTEGALQFVLKYRQRLLGGTDIPIAHMAVRHAHVPQIHAEHQNVHGAGVDFSALPVFQAIRQMQPEVERVVIITGAAPVDLVWEQHLKEQGRLLEGPLRAEF